MSGQVSVPQVSAELGYNLWARTYDSQLNPFLSLEQRIVGALLPPLAGIDIADLGCGTGRWLRPLAAGLPRSLVGVDRSESMLAQAARKVSPRARLVRADCLSLPLQSQSVDLVVSSFLLSYLADLDRFAVELFRICRKGARVLLSDMHTGTCAKHGWRRGFADEGHEYELITRNWSIEYLLYAFQRVGFQVQAMISPKFGAAEKDLLVRSGKLDVYEAAVQDPVLVIIQLQAGRVESQDYSETPARVRTLTQAQIALGPCEAVATDFQIGSSGQIDFVGDVGWRGGDYAMSAATSVNLDGHLVMPGLVNAHDHLEFALFPRLGKGPYDNHLQWADHIHQPELSPVRENRAVPKQVRLWWGGIRNLLAGVTTVCHHNPIDETLLDSEFPVSVVREMDWAHSLTFGGPALKKDAVRRRDVPFVIHLGEGVDRQSGTELKQLDRLQRIDDRTVIVHGLGLKASDRKVLNRRNASLVWCPTSNHFLFGRTHSASDILRFKKVAIGSDSSLTSAGDLLDDIRFAHQTVALPATELYAQATVRAARVLRLKSGQGTLNPGAQADLIAVKNRSKLPAETLVELSFEDIELVVRSGVVQLASRDIMDRLSQTLRAGLFPLKLEGAIRWVRAPLSKLFAEPTRILGSDLTLCGRRLEHVAAS